MSVFYHEISTENCYKSYIQKFWVLNNSQNPLYTTPNYAVPNGCSTIAFVSGNGALLNFGGNIIELSAGVYLSGQITKRVSISLKPFSKAIMAQLKPWLPPVITPISLNELVDNVVSLDNINPAIFQQLADVDLSNEKAVIPALYKALDAFLHINNDSVFIQWVYNRLQANTSTPASIADIADASGYSQRRVEQKFKTLIGLTVKEMQHILQLRQLVDDLSKPNYNNNLGTLAHRYGYYDQSHFIRSYQRIYSEAPSRFNVSDYILPKSGHFDFLQL